ncbi:MAG TPA: oligosaccharide flippase family protein [Terriglobales bacterium]|nr:oligosaccharide flippase family protein [Terriglobales bacterium]
MNSRDSQAVVIKPNKGPVLLPPSSSAHARIVSGSLILLAGSGLVGVANLVYNIAVARMLGPTGFGQATAVYTLLMLMSAVTLSFQIVCAKLVANHEALSDKGAVYKGLHRKAWGIGIAVGALMIVGRGLISDYLNLPSTLLIVLLGVGTAFYIPLGARRGAMQGTYTFHLLALNLIIEGLVRLGGAFVLIKLGLGVTGAVLASVAAVILAYLFAGPTSGLEFVRGLRVATSFREGLQAIVFFAGQVVINNFDIVLVKHFFPSEEAGLYAAVALVGRFVNMCAWSVVSSMFPVSAAARPGERGGRSVLFTSLLLVVLIIGVVLFALWMVPGFFWRVMFGARFELTRYGSISSLLLLYALTTGVYSLSAVIIAYEMSRKIANTGWLQLAFSGALVLGIFWFHDSLRQVIEVQLTLMLLLLAVVLVPALRPRVSDSEIELDLVGGFRKGKPLAQHEVIAEFLKNEFHHPEFDAYRSRLEHLVHAPDLNDRRENNLRRSLLFLRRGAMWRELPADTRWFEVELAPEDLNRVRVFPRAQWRKIAQGNFSLTEISRRARLELEKSDDEFYEKLRQLGQDILDDQMMTTVLLIGVDERSPLTILDGNHRVAASMLAAPAAVCSRFRFICGLSPNMTECCWYRTSVSTLWKYGKNLFRHLTYDPEAEIQTYLLGNV